MALKIAVFTLVVTICKVQSQSIGCLSNQQSSLSNIQPSCGGGSQPQNMQFQPSNSNKVLKASPQLQIMPGQNCNLQAIPISQISQILSQGSNQQRSQTGCGCASPRQGIQGIQVSSTPKIPSQTAQYAQPASQPCACSPTVISAPVSTITIPPSSCATIIDNSLSNSLANALQMMIANDFINSAVSNNIINQDCSIPVVETSVSSFDLSNFLKGLNSYQIGSSQTASTSSCSQPEESNSYDWERLLERLGGDQCGQTSRADWPAVLDYLNSQNDRCEAATVEIEPESSGYDYSSLIDYLKQRGQTASQISNQYPVQGCGQTQNYNLQQGVQSCGQTQNYNLQQGVQSCGQTQNYNLQQGVYVPSSQSDIDSGVLEALAAYLGVNTSDVCSNTYPNMAEVVFPEEIPAQLICNYGYMPTSVPVVSFSVQPIGDSSSNFIVGTQC